MTGASPRAKPVARLGGALAACLAVLAAAIVLVNRSAATQAVHPNALWHVVHDLCVIDMKASGLPAPCSRVDLAGGYAVLRDIKGQTQLLLIPTARISGIESPALLRPGSPNYWQAAWDALPLFEKRTRRSVPRQDVGLAINSIYARSQNQLHIHIDCLRPDVRDALRAHEGSIGRRWSRLDFNLVGHHYRAMRLEGENLGTRDPFKLLAAGDWRARADMGPRTLVVVGATFADGSPGFILLTDRTNLFLADPGAGEELLDHGCAALGRP